MCWNGKARVILPTECTRFSHVLTSLWRLFVVMTLRFALRYDLVNEPLCQGGSRHQLLNLAQCRTTGRSRVDNSFVTMSRIQTPDEPTPGTSKWRDMFTRSSQLKSRWPNQLSAQRSSGSHFCVQDKREELNVAEVVDAGSTYESLYAMMIVFERVLASRALLHHHGT